MAKEKLVLIGNGMAGVRCIEEILALAPERFDITIFGKEPHPNYNRIQLSKVLQGDTLIKDITINDWDWYKNNGITLHAGDPVVNIDTVRRKVFSDQGRIVEYDRLIVATGSLPFMLPLQGADKPGVTAFRDISDCNLMMDTAKTYKKAVVIGGGLLGLEAARGLLNLGMEVQVVHIHNYLMERQLDQTAARMLQEDLEKQGMRFILQKQTDKIIGKKRVEGLQFTDGTKVSADLVVIAVGIRPNIKLAASCGIETNRAIVVNDFMETNVPGIYAVGECAEHRDTVYGLVAPLYDQGKVLAQKLCGIETEGYEGSILYSQLKVSGLEVFSAGEIRDSEISTSYQIYDGIRHIYKKISIRDNKIVGAVLYGDSSEGNKLLGYIKQYADVSVLEEAASGSSSDVEGLSMNATICSCNGVSKGAIIAVVQEHGCETVDDIRACTRASSTCGGCKPLVGEVLRYAWQHKDIPAPPKETVCACTSFSHEELRDALRAAQANTLEGTMQALGWHNEQGCAVCRPALRYYIGTAASVDGVSEGLARAETAAARNSLADGTYAITPRMYGGVTDAEQLRRIADLVEKYTIPLVKLTGARLDLLGIAAEDMQAIRSELDGTVTASGYGQPLGSVETCNGVTYEHGALRDSVRLGAMLERAVEKLQLPCECSAAVSASPLHRAGTLAKDIGIVGAPAGWEIYVGGCSGMKLRQGELLCTEGDETTVIEYVQAFLQWYREEARYGESTGSWIERQGGIIPIRETLFQPHLRKRLTDRMKRERHVEANEQIILQLTAAWNE